MFSLGLGSLYYSNKKTTPLIPLLIKVEIVLTSLGLASPYLILYTSSIQSQLPPFLFHVFIQLPSILIGFFSGLELPTLLDLSKKKSLCLYYDYLGMFIASLLFYILIKQFNLLDITFLVSSLNLFIAFLLLTVFNKKNFYFKLSNIVLFFIISLHWIYREKILLLWQHLILLN